LKVEDNIDLDPFLAARHGKRGSKDPYEGEW
jgi:hypothetical protein